MTATTPQEAEDPRPVSVQKLDLMIDQVAELARSIREINDRYDRQLTGHSQTIIHKTEGMGWVGVVCAAISFCCLLGSLGIGWAVIVELNKQTAELHDLHAWRDIHSNDLATLKAWRQLQEKAK